MSSSGFPLREGAWKAPLLAVTPFMLLALWHWNWPPASTSGDYSQYIMHARALLHGGYADIGYLYHPEAADIGPRMYPPGLPLLLAPLVAIGGVDSILLHLFSVACILLFGVTAWLRLARSVDSRVAACGIAIALLGMEAMLASLVPMSDLPFCAALWLLFLVVDWPDAWSRRRVVLVTVVGFALVGTRLAGVAIVPALGVYWLLHRRTLGLRPLIPVLIWGGAGLVVVAAGAMANSYANPIGASHFDLAGRLTALVRNYRYALLDATLYPFPGDRANEWYHYAIIPVILIGAWGVLKRLGTSFVTCATVMYAALLLTVRVGEARYLWPLAPLLGASIAQGIAMIAGRLWKGQPRSNTGVPRAAIVIPSLIVVAVLVRQGVATRPFAVTGTPDARALYAWLAKEKDVGPARALFHNPRVLTLESGVPAMGLLPRTAPGLVMAMQERNLTHLVWQKPEMSGCLQRIANTVPTLFPDRFTLAWENATFRVYRRRTDAPALTAEVEHIEWKDVARYCPPV